ncbi:MAG: COQ9 family protein [Alphaproteobacteria bacterium]|nr:COQ9 family protein [Alphaproteobacteria bacterium]
MTKTIINGDLQQTRYQLLRQMESLAGFDGMGADGLSQAAQKLTIDENFAYSLFDNADKTTMAHYYWQMRLYDLREDLRGKLTADSDNSVDKMGVTAKVAYGANLFFIGKQDTPHQGQDALQITSASLLLPSNMPLLLKNIWHISDAIWYFAGDTSTDQNYYSKRFLLSQAMLASLCFYVQDSSDNKSDTEDFITSQLRNIVAVGKKMAKGKKAVGNIGDALVLLLKTASPYSKGFGDSPKPPKMPNLRTKQQNRDNPVFITRKLLKNFVKRRIQTISTLS